MTITNDGATILKQLDVEHPAAKVLVELADLQDQEVTIYRHPFQDVLEIAIVQRRLKYYLEHAVRYTYVDENVRCD